MALDSEQVVNNHVNAPVDNTVADKGVSDIEPEVGEGDIKDGVKDDTGGTSDKKPADNWETRYKDLQRDYTKKAEALASLKKYGGTENVVQWLSVLENNPRFAEFIDKERTILATGNENVVTDPETQKAIQTVKELARQETLAVFQKEVQPYIRKIQEDNLNVVFTEMDKKHPDWREHREVMSDISKQFPNIQDAPTVKHVEGLYFMALAEKGKLEETLSEKYKKTLQDKKSKSIDMPSTTSGSKPVRAKTMQEAYMAAKETLKHK